jgi:hypothetical protein
VGGRRGAAGPDRRGWTGAISLGFGPGGKCTRIKRKGKSKAAGKKKLVDAGSTRTSSSAS